MSFIKDCILHVDRMHDAIEHAIKLGTFNKADRSQQYPIATEKQLVDAVNLALTNTRRNEDALKEKAEEIAKIKRSVESRIWHRLVLVAAIAEWAIIVMLLEKWPK